MLVGMGVHTSVPIITDGRFFGATSGSCVRHMCPEACEGRPFAYVRDGNPVAIDIPAGRIELLLSGEEMAKRPAGEYNQPVHLAPGMLFTYRKTVGGAEKGAVWL